MELEQIKKELDFSIIFSADMESQTIPVPGNEDSYIVLKPMNAREFQKYQMQVLKVQAAISEGRTEALNPLDLMMGLITPTVVDIHLLHPPKETADGDTTPEAFSTIKQPITDKKKAMIAKVLPECSPAFFQWVFEECSKINGVDKEAEKN